MSILSSGPPTELGGPGGAANPESLFVAGFAGCFKSALMAVGRREGVDLSGSEVRVEVTLGMRPEATFDLAVRLDVTMSLDREADAATLVAAASRMCPYSRAIRGNVPVETITSLRRPE